MITQKIVDLHDAWILLDKHCREVVGEPDSVFLIVCHAKYHVDRQIKAELGESQ